MKAVSQRHLAPTLKEVESKKKREEVPQRQIPPQKPLSQVEQEQNLRELRKALSEVGTSTKPKKVDVYAERDRQIKAAKAAGYIQ